MPNLILASSSPRRKELLQQIRLPFHIHPSTVSEEVKADLPPKELVAELAIRKAKDVANKYPHDVVLGADTVVVLNGKILGKPVDRENARNMLQALSGNTHEVLTGVAIVYNETVHHFVEKTEVTFWELSAEEIEQYLNSGEPFDKAGAYGIQGLGATFVKRIDGDYFSVVGLPISKVHRVLKRLSVEFS
ncbi:MAG: septum formation inhibitor Maf [Bacillus sp. (in: Bacteria)]|nr:septum formation inhibitor Maf [Bacillus sp. (in: firmicutes)]